MDKYAGYLYCGECGSKLYLHRAVSIKPGNNFFQCARYQTHGGNHCTAHYVREQLIDQIVLGNLKKMTSFAQKKPEEFYAIATQNGEAEAYG